MFIGHFAVGLAAKKAAPKVSLGALFAASQFIDLLWPVLVLLGIETVEIEPGNTVVTPLNFTHYPFSHSLAGVLFWSALVGAIGFWRYRDRASALILAGCVSSHWFLDLITHRPDLPLLNSDGIRVGLSLWNSLAGTIAVEGALFIAALFLYLKTTHSLDRIGKFGFYALVALLAGIWLGNFFGPPPPSAQTIGIAGNLTWLFVFMGHWVDRHRTAS